MTAKRGNLEKNEKPSERAGKEVSVEQRL